MAGVNKTFRMTDASIRAIERMTLKFCAETKIKFSMSNVLEIIIFYAEKKSLTELLQMPLCLGKENESEGNNENKTE